MTSILVPVDYQRHTESVIEYAKNLAKNLNAEIVLFHCFQLPLVSAETSYVQYPLEELYEDNTIALEKIKSKIIGTEGNNTQVHNSVKPGFPGTSIVEEAEQKKCDLILMTSSERTKLGEKLIGSTSVYVARHSKIPVLLLPENYSYKTIRRILISVKPDTIFHEHYLVSIKLFSKIFNAKTELMSFISENDQNKKNNLKEWTTTLEIAEKDVHYFKSGKEHLSNSIINAANLGDSDLLVTFPQRHSLIDKLFQENITKELAFHTNCPVLTIHE